MNDEFPPVICPTCGHVIAKEGEEVERRVWLFNQRFYCSEQCVRIAAGAR